MSLLGGHPGVSCGAEDTIKAPADVGGEGLVAELAACQVVIGHPPRTGTGT